LAHGVTLKVWLLLVLAAEAPAVAGQVPCLALPRAHACLA